MTTVVGCAQKVRLFYIRDKNYRHNFFVNIGVEISVLPLDLRQKLVPGAYKLQAVHDTKIDTSREKPFTVILGMFEDFYGYSCKPIRGADFLAHFNLSVNIDTRSLTDSIRGIRSS